MSAKDKSSIRIKSVHPLYSDGYAYAVLESFDWDFKRTGQVYVVTPNGRLRMFFAGAGDLHGAPFVKLVPEDKQQLDSLESLVKESPNDLRLERVSGA